MGLHEPRKRVTRWTDRVGSGKTWEGLAMDQELHIIPYPSVDLSILKAKKNFSWSLIQAVEYNQNFELWFYHYGTLAKPE